MLPKSVVAAGALRLCERVEAPRTRRDEFELIVLAHPTRRERGMPRRAINSADYRVPIQGFSQVIEAAASGRLLFVSGLTSRDADGAIVSVGDIEGQARQVLRRMAGVLKAADATLDDVVQIRTYVLDMEDWPVIEVVWREVWSEPWPASTCVEVSRLHDTRQLIEMDAVAVVPVAV